MPSSQRRSMRHERAFAPSRRHPQRRGCHASREARGFAAGWSPAATSVVWATVIARRTPATPPESRTIRAEPPAPRAVTVPAPAAIDPSELELEPTPSAVPRLRPGPPSSASMSSRSDEVSLLAQARRKLADQPKEALALTARHAAEFPSSALAEERAALEIEGLFKLAVAM